MNANELMIGDWVRIMDDALERQYLNDYKPGQMLRVTEILDYGINPEWSGAEVDDVLHFDIIEPIPLTPEILEKSGFELISDARWKQEYMWSTGCVEEYADVYILVGSDHSGKLRWDFPSLHIRQYKGEIILHKFRYVHELQHVLRVCGIEKEIEL